MYHNRNERSKYEAYIKNDYPYEYGSSNICELKYYKLMYQNKSPFFY